MLDSPGARTAAVELDSESRLGPERWDDRQSTAIGSFVGQDMSPIAAIGLAVVSGPVVVATGVFEVGRAMEGEWAATGAAATAELEREPGAEE